MSVVCRVNECDTESFALGMCQKHYRRLRTHGSTETIAAGGRPLTGSVLSIAGVHKRLARERGPASRAKCVDCGSRAAEWSYDNSDANELRGMKGKSLLAYSLDLNHYVARCIPCHRHFDAAHRGEAA